MTIPMTIFYLPDLGEGLAEAEIHEWHIKIGDEIAKQQNILTVETAKALVEIPSPFTGRISQLFAKPGDVVETGAPLFECITQDTKINTQQSIVGKLETQSIPSHSKALPATRLLAKKLGVDIEQMVGHGKNSEITAQDIEKNKALPNWLTNAETLHGPRRAMAYNMHKAHLEVARAAFFGESNIEHWPEKTDVTARLIQAMIVACQKEPSLNAWYDFATQKRLLHKNINVGIATDTPQGLFVPVIKNVQEKTSAQLRDVINYYKKQLTTGHMQADDLQGSTIALSNFGKFAGHFALPMVMPPTIAIVASGKITADYRLPISLAFDHRAVTGGEAARFLDVLLAELNQ